MRVIRRRRHVLALALVSCIVFTACPTSSQLDKAAKASNDIGRYTGEAIAVTKTLYETQMISLAQKDAIAGKLLLLSQNGKTFNELVISLHNQYANSPLPPTAWATLSRNFDALSAVFIQLLDSIGSTQLAASKAMRIIRAAVITLAALLSSNGVYVRDLPLLQNA